MTCLTSFAELFGTNQGVDRVRNQNVPKTGPTLDYLGIFFHPYRSVTRFLTITIDLQRKHTPPKTGLWVFDVTMALIFNF
jgi:hypothetical protein